ncbi:unnamed protein product [Chrysoparadoxa australica]
MGISTGEEQRQEGVDAWQAPEPEQPQQQDEAQKMEDPQLSYPYMQQQQQQQAPEQQQQQQQQQQQAPEQQQQQQQAAAPDDYTSYSFEQPDEVHGAYDYSYPQELPQPQVQESDMYASSSPAEASLGYEGHAEGIVGDGWGEGPDDAAVGVSGAGPGAFDSWGEEAMPARPAEQENFIHALDEEEHGDVAMPSILEAEVPGQGAAGPEFEDAVDAEPELADTLQEEEKEVPEEEDAPVLTAQPMSWQGQGQSQDEEPNEVGRAADWEGAGINLSADVDHAVEKQEPLDEAQLMKGAAAQEGYSADEGAEAEVDFMAEIEREIDALELDLDSMLRQSSRQARDEKREEPVVEEAGVKAKEVLEDVPQDLEEGPMIETGYDDFEYGEAMEYQVYDQGYDQLGRYEAQSYDDVASDSYPSPSWTYYGEEEDAASLENAGAAMPFGNLQDEGEPEEVPQGKEAGSSIGISSSSNGGSSSGKEDEIASDHLIPLELPTSSSTHEEQFDNEHLQEQLDLYWQQVRQTGPAQGEAQFGMAQQVMPFGGMGYGAEIEEEDSFPWPLTARQSMSAIRSEKPLTTPIQVFGDIHVHIAEPTKSGKPRLGNVWPEGLE